MQVKVTRQDPAKTKSACLVLGVYSGKDLTPSAMQFDRTANGKISGLKKRGDVSGKTAETLLLTEYPGIEAERVMLVGLGAKGKTKAADFRRAARAAAFAVHKAGIKDAAMCLTEAEVIDTDAAFLARIIAEAASDATYQYDATKSVKTKPGLGRINIVLNHEADDKTVKTGANTGAAIAKGVALAKELGNLPGNICTPTYLANYAKGMKKSHGLKVTILEEAHMEKLGMGSLLSVSRGSREPAKLIVMEYAGGKKGDKPIALVGKGLTFDAGGISLKPSGKMDEMKYDMGGAASVFGTIQAIADMKLKINVVGVVPSSENLPDGAANKPGDIVTSMSGRTIEILNTDAEGRLILCDALTWVEQKIKPKAVIDIATLTGACIVALGAHASGLCSNHQTLADELLKAGQQAGDRAWQLPIWSEYDKQLCSSFADIANIGGPGGGAITAACFLARFTSKMCWAHLDIAGTAWNSGGSKGGTGRPVSLLTQYLINQC